MAFEISVIDAVATSAHYDETADRLRDAKPAFRDVLDILEEGEQRHFARLRGKYVRTGALMASLTQPTANDAIREAHGDGLVFGTGIYYAQFLTASRKSRSGEVTKRKGKSAVLVLLPKAKKAASQAILDFALEPFDDAPG